MSEPDGVRLVAVQSEHPADPVRDVGGVLERAARAVAQGGIAVLPEYFYMPPGGPPTPERLERVGDVEERLVEASATIDGALVGTVPEFDEGRTYNCAVVAEGGGVVHRQRKLRPTPGETEAGIAAGGSLAVADVQGVTLGVLVCADVLALDLVAALAAKGPDVVAVPVLSPRREGDATVRARTSVFVARAWDLRAYVVKAGGHAGDRIVGRSLITAPWGVLAQAASETEDALLSAVGEPGRLAPLRETFDPLGAA